MIETRLETRWTDFDALGHITHWAYPVLLDEGRDRYLQATVGGFVEWPCVVAHLSLDHRAEIAYPAPVVVVTTRVTRIGRSSVTFEQDVRVPGGEPAAVSTSVLVAWDPELRTSRPIGDDERESLSAPAG